MHRVSSAERRRRRAPGPPAAVQAAEIARAGAVEAALITADATRDAAAIGARSTAKASLQNVLAILTAALIAGLYGLAAARLAAPTGQVEGTLGTRRPPISDLRLACVLGVTGFEPATSWTPSKRAASLRHTPDEEGASSPSSSCDP